MIFPQEFIERVKDSSDLVEVIGQYVTLTKKGPRYLGLCPFHTEKTPSFTVSPDRGIYKCFGCGAGGTVISFVMEYEKMSFVESIEFLAKRAGIEIPKTEEKPQKKSDRDILFKAVMHGQKFFREQYKKSTVPKEYLKSRNFSNQLAEKMELGYAPDGWDNFTKTLKGGHKEMVSVGLLRARDNKDGYYDYFRNRLIFPIKDLSGRVCAFGGRLLGEEDEHNAKYLNSPESPVYSKGSLLYAIGQNREFIRKAGFAYLVEGYTDLLRLMSCGIDNCAAGLGTAFTIQQARLLKRYAEKTVLLYDGDEAGVKAAVKTGKILLSAGMDVEVTALPPEHDPDTFLQEKGAEGLDNIRKKSLLKFQYDSLIEDPVFTGKLDKITHEMLDGVVYLSDEIKRSIAIREISELVGLPENAIMIELKKMRRKQNRVEEDTIESKTLTFGQNDIVERDLIRLLAKSPELGNDIFTSLNPDLIKHKKLNKIFLTIKSLWLKGEVKTSTDIIDAFEEQDVKGFLAECALWDTPGYDVEFLQDTRKKLEQREFELRMYELERQIKETQTNGKVAEDLILLRFRMNKAAKKGADYAELLKEIQDTLPNDKT